MSRSGGRWRTLYVAVVGLICTWSVAACGTPDGADHGQLSTEQMSVRQGYFAYWDALLDASAKGDPDATTLADYAAGNQLTVVQGNISNARARGLIARGTVGHHILEISVYQRLAYVTDCVDVTDWLQYDSARGTLIPDQLFERPSQRARFTLAPRGDLWMVTATRELGAC
jgi:hypothetical protein